MITLIIIIVLIMLVCMVYTMYEVPENSIKELIYKDKVYYLYEFNGTKHIFAKKINKERREFIFFGKKIKVINLENKLLSSNDEEKINLFLEKQ